MKSVCVAIAIGTTLLCSIPAQTQINNGNASHARQLSFADRVAYQRAIEQVYWRHRVWPKENSNPKASLNEFVPSAQIEKKVEEYLLNSQALVDYGQPLTGAQLQAEMDRMAQHTQQSDVLRELFAALGNDPFVVAECLARPGLSERLTRDHYRHDAGFHEKTERRREADLPRYATVSWKSRVENQRQKTMSATTTGYTLPTIPDSAFASTESRFTSAYEMPEPARVDVGCTNDTWRATSLTNAPSGRWGHTAVWTGAEMIVWGGYDGGADNGVTNTGGRYNPATDTWTTTSTTNAPQGRFDHAAVWTGSEMIVWSGNNNQTAPNTGGRYNPATDSWIATSVTNAPPGQDGPTAVWTGNEMIVWGKGYNGSAGLVNTGGRYNPTTNSWIATSTANAPSPRAGHTAVWTGNEMIVWGGWDGSFLNTGGRYNPTTNSWTATSTTNAPSGRAGHTAVWTGNEMIVWAGYDGSLLNTGRRYDPQTNSWIATNTVGVPASRRSHAAFWTGVEMIVWGGSGGNTGGRYNVSSDSWTSTSTTNAPSGVLGAVWTGAEMIVWGSADIFPLINTGARYCASTTGAGQLSPPALVLPGNDAAPGQSINTTTPSFNWQPVTGADRYDLFISERQPNSTYQLVFNTQTLGITIPGGSNSTYSLPSGYLHVGGSYRWNMSSHNAAGSGPANPNRFYFNVIAPQSGSLNIYSIDPVNTQQRDWGQSVTYTVFVKGPDGLGIQGASVAGEDNVRSISFLAGMTDSNGRVNYQTTVPSGKPNGTYPITFQASKSGYTTSGTVSRQVQVVHSATTPTVTITSPIGGENWNVGSNHTATATSTGSILSYHFEFSTNGGSTWQPMGGSPDTVSPSLQWIVPNQPSNQCRARVTANYQGGSVSATSPSAFTITSAGSGACPSPVPHQSQLGAGNVTGDDNYDSYRLGAIQRITQPRPVCDGSSYPQNPQGESIRDGGCFLTCFSMLMKFWAQTPQHAAMIPPDLNTLFVNNQLFNTSNNQIDVTRAANYFQQATTLVWRDSGMPSYNSSDPEALINT